MARTYGNEFINLIATTESTRTGINLAKACLKANLPAKYVAQLMNVSRMTIYSWFRGKPLRDKNEEAAKVFIKLIETDLVNGKLPVRNLSMAKQYIDDIIGEPTEEA